MGLFDHVTLEAVKSSLDPHSTLNTDGVALQKQGSMQRVRFRMGNMWKVEGNSEDLSQSQ